MPQIPILNGVGADTNADYRTSYPVNLVPVVKETGISKGYLRAASGLTQLGEGPGVDRGGIWAFDRHYRVMGGSLVTVSAAGAVAAVGAVSGSGRASFDYSFDRLCVVADGKAWLTNGGGLTQITDSDVGVPRDVIWIDGYFMFTDGPNLYVTELNNPFAIDPLKYGSSEIDPDPVVALLKYKGEAYALNRYTIEVFDNVGGTGFPFQRITGGLITKGCVGKDAKALFGETFAWVGGGRNEPVSVYAASAGSALKIATREIEIRLAQYTEAQLAATVVEARADRVHQHLLIHLPGETLVYDAAASVAAGEPMWFFLSTGVAGINPYRARNFVWAYNRWTCGDTQDGRIGYMDESLATQYGEVAGWQFDTLMLYNEGRGLILHEVELAGTVGRAPFGTDPVAFMSWTVDGLTWSDEKTARMGKAGQTSQRVVWRRLGRMESVKSLRFRGANTAPVSWARLQAELEPLA